MFLPKRHLLLLIFAEISFRNLGFCIFKEEMNLESKYFAELARRLQTDGITTSGPDGSRLPVLLNDLPVLFCLTGERCVPPPCWEQQCRSQRAVSQSSYGGR